MSEFVDVSAGGAVSLAVRVLDAGAVLDQLVAERASADRSEARVLALAVHFVDLHPVTEQSPAASWAEQPVLDIGEEPRLAGVGTPGIAGCAVEELGAVLGVPYGSALQLVADSVELCHRLPRLWEAVHTGRVPAWRARQVARETVGLCGVGAGFVDRQVAVLVGRRRFPTVGQVREVVHQARLLVDPDREAAVEEMALSRRGVWFDHQTSTASAATTSMTAVLDAWDALDLDAALGDLAGTMGRLGDTSPVDVRRAGALALLAHPQRVLDLTTSPATATATDTGTIAATEAATDTERGAEASTGVGVVAAGTMPGHRTVVGGGAVTPGSVVTLYAHANLSDLAPDARDAPDAQDGRRGGQAVVERLGPAALEVVCGWLGRTDRVVLRPVLHLDGPAGPERAGSGVVDRHDPPDRIREEVILRDGQCVFPGCRVDARRCDLDHIVAYVDPDQGGPPGQTGPENLACLCRRHHRLKTFTGWDYQRLPGDSYRWTSPRGTRLPSHPLPTTGPPG